CRGSGPAGWGSRTGRAGAGPGARRGGAPSSLAEFGQQLVGVLVGGGGAQRLAVEGGLVLAARGDGAPGLVGLRPRPPRRRLPLAPADQPRQLQRERREPLHLAAQLPAVVVVVTVEEPLDAHLNQRSQQADVLAVEAEEAAQVAEPLVVVGPPPLRHVAVA